MFSFTLLIGARHSLATHLLLNKLKVYRGFVNSIMFTVYNHCIFKQNIIGIIMMLKILILMLLFIPLVCFSTSYSSALDWALAKCSRAPSAAINIVKTRITIIMCLTSRFWILGRDTAARIKIRRPTSWNYELKKENYLFWYTIINFSILSILLYIKFLT